MSRRKTEHGEMYNQGCRCAPCVQGARDAWRDYYHTYRKHYIRGDRRVSVDPAMAHLKELRAAGMGYARIATQVDISKAMLQDIGSGRRRYIMRSTEVRVLSATLDTAMIDPTGTMRRLRALAAIGYTFTDLAAAVGVTPYRGVRGLCVGEHRRVLKTTAEATKVAYANLSMRRGGSVRAAKRAAEKGWAPPLAWDDETIDDPSAEPHGVRKQGASTGRLDLAEWEELVQAGESVERAADRCGVSLSAVERAAHRAGRRDLATLASTARNQQRLAA